MSTITKSVGTVRARRPLSWRRVKRGFAIWFRGTRSRHELMNLSDACLRDIGLARHGSDLKSCKPFWMA